MISSTEHQTGKEKVSTETQKQQDNIKEVISEDIVLTETQKQQDNIEEVISEDIVSTETQKQQDNIEEVISEDIVSTETQKQQDNIEEVISEKMNITKDSKDLLIAELETKLALAQQKERDTLLRTKAEIQNMRRRIEIDIEKAHKFALENIMESLLPVIDNLERALEMSDKSNNDIASTIEGIELTLKSMLDVLSKFGLDSIKDTNVPFNPKLHQAMTMLESDEYEANRVIMIMQKGYTLHGRLIRPAMVAISKVKEVR